MDRAKSLCCPVDYPAPAMIETKTALLKCHQWTRTDGKHNVYYDFPKNPSAYPRRLGMGSWRDAGRDIVAVHVMTDREI